ncbi:peptidylprolyl isomerase [Candidatus Woesearchaeota archaeon]|nr:peptidylprolyl isomerase [Candidatus Woesearchaeota archaeon]
MKAIYILSIVALTLLLTSCGETMKNRHAIFETSLGTITLELAEDKMPVTTANFIKLAQSGFYDGTRFHRVIGPAKAPPNGFMIQGGDPLSKDPTKQGRWGTGGPGYNIKDEFHKEMKNVRGTIAMANAGPNTGGSQFFINIADNNYLDRMHPVFGNVTGGMDVVNAIATVKTNSQDRPLEDVVVLKVRIE